MLSYSNLSDGFWREAMLTACHILSRVPSRTNKETPYELWYKKKPNLSYLKVWGCQGRKKLGERGLECIFIGYANKSKAYWFYVIEQNDYISIHSIIESRDAIFDENRFSSIGRQRNLQISTGDDDVEFENIQQEHPQEDDVDENQQIVLQDTPMDEEDIPRRNKRQRKAKTFGPIFMYI